MKTKTTLIGPNDGLPTWVTFKTLSGREIETIGPAGEIKLQEEDRTFVRCRGEKVMQVLQIDEDKVTYEDLFKEAKRQNLKWIVFGNPAAVPRAGEIKILELIEE